MRPKPRYSIVTCVSNYDIYEKCLLKSLRLHDNNDNLYEVIPIDNRNNAYSASEAYNLGLMIATSDIIINCHQDVSVLDDFFIKLDESILRIKDENWGVIGCSGVSIHDQQNVGIVFNSFSSEDINQAIDKKMCYYEGIKSITEVYSIDECLFVIRKRQGIRFNDELRGFHLYGVDICLNYRANGYKVYATELPIIHYGEFSSSIIYDRSYWKAIRQITKKWSSEYGAMIGTYASWYKTSDHCMEITSHLKTSTDAETFRAHIYRSSIKEISKND